MGSPPRPPDTHTDCTQTHTDCTKHTPGLHTNTHILLPIVVFALQPWTKTHTCLERKSIFFWRGAPATKNMFAFLAHSGRPRHLKIRYFWHPGALSQKHTHTRTHTHIGPWGLQTHTRIAHKHTHTHTDCTKHTHGMHINTHLLLPIVVFAVKTLTKTHTDLERKPIFLYWGLPQQ